MNYLQDFSKIYVFCPIGTPTGGLELLHQLVDYLRNQQQEAYIYYYNSPLAEVPLAYNKYNIATVPQVEDCAQNVIVFPEIAFHLSVFYKSTKKVFWWLSIDNYYYKEKRHIPIYEIYNFSKIYALKQIWHRFVGLFRLKWYFGHTFSIRGTVEKNYIHAYQSEYARLHLKKCGVRNLCPLKDYINTSFSSDMDVNRKRNPCILYNPKKGIEFTRKLKKHASDLTFIPLENLSRGELQDLFRSSMLYIDFGNHPGMDRLPREAALNGCCVMTGKRGAAANEVDIPIDSSKYKYDEFTTPVGTIIDRIRDILATYEECISDFERYRERIKMEEKEFHNQIDTLFHL